MGFTSALRPPLATLPFPPHRSFSIVTVAIPASTPCRDHRRRSPSAQQRLTPMAASISSVGFPVPLTVHSSSPIEDGKASLFTVSPPPNPTLKTPTIRSRLSKLCQEGKPELARHLFDTIPQPTTAMWNTIIIGFICNDMPVEALRFYGEMKKGGFPTTKGDYYTYSSTLKACSQSLNLGAGRAIHCHLIRCLEYPSRIVYNSLLNMYSTCLSQLGSSGGSEFSKYDAVRKVFDTMGKRDVVAWNILVSWYVKTERHVRAVRQFRRMMKMEIKPSPVSFVSVFPAISAMQDLDTANVMYGLLVKLGGEYTTDLFVVSSAIIMYSELGCLDLARKVFDCCLVNNTEVWNSMIGGYVQNNRPREAINLFLLATQTGQTDNISFLSVLTAVSQLQCLDLAQQLHGFVIKNLGSLPVIIQNAIIVMYSRCNTLHTSFHVFGQMQERDVVSWNTMISAFVQNGFDDEGLILVYEMQKQKFAIDLVTVTALLSAASNLRNLQIGKQTHAYLLRQDIKFDGMDSYLVDMYAKCGSIRTAEYIFWRNITRSVKDQATWNAMIAGYTHHGLVEEALATFNEMLQQAVSPNAVTLASILPGCTQMGSINLGKQLHAVSIRHLFENNIFLSSALIDMYSKSGSINYAENVFARTSDKNSVTYTTMILGYGQHGLGSKALSLFHSMGDSGVKPDAVTLVAVLSACSHAGLVDEGLRIFNSMEMDFNIEPSVQHYCCVADMLGRVGRVVEAYEFVEQLGEKGDVLQIWGSVLGACRLHGCSELAETVGEKIRQLEEAALHGGVGGYQVLMSNMYAGEGDWRNVDRVRKEMKEKGSMKLVGRSWIDIGGHVARFSSKDQDHHQFDEIYGTLEGLALEMKHSGA
ncbi:unnamed protein product [Linum trigynum]|uniref:Pentatricopeptide repeat-containing protein n=1 Tax=Linum trigynum TaxID=586398 RepID=A0AAV2C8G2_9ROSI